MGYETEKQELPEGFTHLGEDMEHMHGMHAVDAASAAHKNHEKPKVYYPELHFEGEQAQHLMKHLAKHGTAHIHFKKVSESTHHETRHGKSETRHRVGIQIHGIKPLGEHGDKSESKVSMKVPKENPEDSIEKGLEAAEAESTV
jgi:hypothetical protein